MRSGIAALLALLLVVSAGCGKDETPTSTAPMFPTTLQFRVSDREGHPPIQEARRALVDVIRDRLAAIGEERPRLRFVDDTTFEAALTTKDPTLVELSRREILRNVDFQIRIRVSPHLENAERIRRDQRGDEYAPPPRTAWVPAGDGQFDMLVAVPEADAARRMAELGQAEPFNRVAFEGAEMELKRILIRGVFGAGDIADAEAVHGIAQGGRSAVGVVIRPERAEAFQNFTELYRNQPFVALMDGRVIYTAILVEPLRGQIVLGDPDGFSSEAAERIAEALRRAAYGTVVEPLD